MCCWQKSITPGQVSRVGASVIDHHDVAGQVSRLTAQSVSQPSSHAWTARLVDARAQLKLAGCVIEYANGNPIRYVNPAGLSGSLVETLGTIGIKTTIGAAIG